VRALLDTHTFLWFISDSPRLSATARMTIQDGGNEILLSVASVWEMAIKSSLGKLTLPDPFATFVTEQMRLNEIALLDITVTHAAMVERLPYHHRDPFDRLLVAQASVEDVDFIGADSVFDGYGIRRLW
jgi:PIN domain nuclease of toxin-antitoxin system